MPRYLFHFTGYCVGASSRLTTEAADQTAAIELGRALARDMGAQLVLEDEPIDGQCVVVADETGRVVGTVRYRDVIRVSGG